MGYSTDFEGKLKFNRKLTEKEANFINKLAETRRMARNVDPKYGVEGEFYVEGDDWNDPTVIDGNAPPRTQPGLWCQWVVTDDRQFLEWDGGEKFYNYVEWLEYIINNVFPYILEDGDEPLMLSGVVEWQGEESNDIGRIVVNNNVVSTHGGHVAYDEDATRLFFVTDSDGSNEELFETLEAAKHEVDNMAENGENPRLRVCLVRNAYRDGDRWNYDDNTDTFETIKVLE